MSGGISFTRPRRNALGNERGPGQYEVIMGCRSKFAYLRQACFDGNRRCLGLRLKKVARVARLPVRAHRGGCNPKRLIGYRWAALRLISIS
jgi:hypothetical protein